MGSPLQLGTYYEKQFRPTIEKTLTAGRLKIYDRAVELFTRFAGDELRLNQVTEKHLSGFITCRGARWIHSEKHRRELAGCIRRIVRARRPGQLREARARDVAEKPPKAGSALDYFDRVYAPRVLFACAPRTAPESRPAIRLLNEHFGRDVLLRELSDQLAAIHFAWLSAQGLRPATVNQHRAIIFAVWRHAYDAGLVNRLPRVKKIRELREAPDAWTPEQLAAVLAAADGFRAHRTYSGIPCNLFWRALVLVAWWTGLRRATLFGIRQLDVDLATGWLTVPAHLMKNKRGKRFRLGEDAVAALRVIWQPKRELVFPQPFAELSTMGDHLGLIVAAAGVPPGRHAAGLNRFHMIRRSTATAAAIAGGEAAACELLGHSSGVVTARYLDPAQLPGHDATRFLPQLNSYEEALRATVRTM
jgi:integrase